MLRIASCLAVCVVLFGACIAPASPPAAEPERVLLSLLISGDPTDDAAYQALADAFTAANPDVRTEMVRRQREWATTRGGGVMEGRDIGSVVFPDAVLKVYLTAAPEVRAQRRSQEVTDLDSETVAADLARRDALDEGREASPLAQADDALVVDTTGRGIDEIVDDLAARVP